MTILLLEDDELVAKIFAFHLSEMGHQVIVSFGNDSPYKVFLENEIDLIISDIMMPHSSGITAIKSIQAIPGNQTPVIIVSGIENSLHYLSNRGVRYNAFIQKPFAVDVLLDKVTVIENQLLVI
jgi:two-component system, OmpR family, response regulator VanR